MNKYIGLYIGPNKIIKITKSKRLTYLGNDIYQIEYENGITEERPKEIIEKITSKDKYDLTELRDKIGRVVVEKFLTILLESEVKIEDIEFILHLTAQSMNTNLEQANEFLWKKKLYDRTTADVQKVLKQIQKHGTKTKSKSTKE